MSRYIDADNLFESLTFSDNKFEKLFKEILDDEPTAEVKPIEYGEWLYTGDMFNEGELVCSKCGHKIDVADKNTFCPKCGATMKKKSEE